MTIPVHLKHKPVLGVPNYNAIDGPYKNTSDAEGLSIGIAQWNDVGTTDLSVKVWRKPDARWSRQSEELPLHRAIDLVSLICSAIAYCQDSNTLTSTNDFPVSRVTDNPNLEYHTKLMNKELKKNKKDLDKSLERLAKQLAELGYYEE